jgi:hypothetical protein
VVGVHDRGSAFIDAEASWVPDGDRRAAWEVIAGMAPPVGYDPAPTWPDGPDAPRSAVLWLDPFRIRVQLGSEVASGIADRSWVRRDG